MWVICYYRMKGWIMFKLTSVTGAIAGVVLSLAAGAASASVIDFTKTSTGTSGALFGGSVTWSMTSNGTLNNSQAFDGNSAPAGSPLAFQTDGYGVGDDEITGGLEKGEWITVSFSTPTLIDALYFLDLFIAPNGVDKELAYASVNGGSSVFQAVATEFARPVGAPGYVALTFAPVLVSSIKFYIGSINDALGKPDGALAGIGIAPIPVPAAGLMLLGGLGGLAALRRRKRAA